MTTEPVLLHPAPEVNNLLCTPPYDAVAGFDPDADVPIILDGGESALEAVAPYRHEFFKALRLEITEKIKLITDCDDLERTLKPRIDLRFKGIICRARITREGAGKVRVHVSLAEWET